MTNNQFHICKPRSIKTVVRITEEQNQADVLKTKQLAKILLSRTFRRMNPLNAICLPLSFSILSPGKAIFFSLSKFHCKYPSQVYPKIIMCVLSPCTLKDVSLLETIRKFCSEKRAALTWHSLIICISAIHFSPLSQICPGE